MTVTDLEAFLLSVETLLDDTQRLPEDAPETGVGGEMYAAGWHERADAIRDQMSRIAKESGL